jgi:arsenical pump membrane protein
MVMAPISLAGALLTYGILRWHYRHVLEVDPASSSSLPVPVPAPHRAERPALTFLLVVFLSYPVMAALGAPIWSVALAGAIGCVVISRIYAVADTRTVAGHVSLDILAFLWGVFLVVAGLRQVGVVDALAGVYQSYETGSMAQIGVVGVVSAVGSAIVDNHPMSVLNMMALGHAGSARPLLAALVGGDIGPRLLPIGSLAGLLWMDLLRRRGIDISIGKFVRLGTMLLVPTLALSLLLLWLS